MINATNNEKATENTLDMCEFCNEPIELGEDYGYEDFLAYVFVGNKNELTHKANYETYIPMFHNACKRQEGKNDLIV